MAAPIRNPRNPSARGERTRSAILGAAEELFAARGFDGTRVEDVADAVGIRRASIVYYFRDKRSLYASVLGDLLDALRGSIEQALSGPLSGQGPLGRRARVEAAVCSWVDFLAERPTFARLLLRELAGPPDAAAAPAIREHLGPFVELVRRFLDEPSARDGSFPDALDAAHVASAVAGASVFYATALPRLLPGGERGALSPEDSDTHRDAVLAITRRLLGIAAPGTPGSPREETN